LLQPILVRCISDYDINKSANTHFMMNGTGFALLIEKAINEVEVSHERKTNITGHW
jgi:hypothetical protein